MRFGVLGPLAVWAAGGSPVPVPEPKVRTVLAVLTLHAGRPVPADHLVEVLWPADLPARPANALQTKVSQLRRALDAAEPGGRRLVRHEAGGYVLAAGPDDVDAARFAALVERASAGGDAAARVALLTEALALWRGPGVADLDEYVLTRPAVARLQEARLAAVERRAEARLELGQHREAVAELAAPVAEHPERERLCAAWMLALYRSGRQHDALAAYGGLRRRLADDLGLEPSPGLQALELAILRQDPSLDAPAAPGAPAPVARAPALPAPATPLVGRADAVRATRARLRDARLVTLVGPGGVGKTRLAVEAARGHADEVADGVALVELAALPPSAPAGAPGARQATVLAVAEAVAAALGVPTGPADLPARLGDAVSERRMLLVLDNCEHVADGAAGVAGTLLEAAPGLRVLATSREPLRLAAEVVLEVAPLDLPPPGEDPARVAERAAVQLFAARAAAVAPGFAVTAGNAAAVAEACRRLDGLPLAIELAAARMRALDVHDLARRLDDRFPLLADGRRDADDRHRTLFAVVDWSWQLLGEDERTVLRRLATFPDRFDVAAAEAVAAGGPVPRGAVAGLLAGLVDRSVVTRTAAGADPLGPAAPYRLPESVAAHARTRPGPPGEAEATRRRHRHYVADLVAGADAGLRGPDQRAWLRRLDEAAPDVRAALAGAADDRDAVAALRIALATSWYWFLRGRAGEAVRSLGGALALPGAPAGLRACAGAWAAGFAVLAGDGPDPADAADDLARTPGGPGDRARAEWFLGHALAGVDDGLGAELNERALRGFRDTGDAWGQAAALADRAWHAWQRGDLPAVRHAAQDAGSRFTALGDRWGRLQADQMLEQLAEVAGDYEQAAALDRAALDTAADLGLPGDTAYALCRLGRVTLLQGDVAAALDLHTRARRIAVDHAHVPLTQVAEIGIALCHRRLGDLDQAEATLRRWLDWNRARANAPGVALVAAQLGFVADQRGHAEQARARHDEAHAAALTTGDPRMIALTQEGQAGAHSLAGDRARATALLAAARAARAGAGAALPPAERFDLDRITARLR